MTESIHLYLIGLEVGRFDNDLRAIGKSIFGRIENFIFGRLYNTAFFGHLRYKRTFLMLIFIRFYRNLAVFKECI